MLLFDTTTNFKKCVSSSKMNIIYKLKWAIPIKKYKKPDDFSKNFHRGARSSLYMVQNVVDAFNNAVKSLP